MPMRRMGQFMLAVGIMAGAGALVHADEHAQTARTLTGIATAKGDNWIEVRAEGSKEATRYRARWIGGLPKDGGGPDKAAVEAIHKVATPGLVRIQWLVAEGPRVVALESCPWKHCPLPPRKVLWKAPSQHGVRPGLK